MSSSVYGRFVLEQDANRLRLRARTTDATGWLRLGSLGLFVLLAIQPELFTPGPPAGPQEREVGLATALRIVGPLLAMMVVMVIGWRAASARGRARSRHPRLGRELEARWQAAHGHEGAFREAAPSSAPAITVDGRAFSPADYTGVVTFVSSEYKYPGSKNPEKTERLRPTVVMRDALVELDVFEAADGPDARALADAVASGLARGPAKAPSLRWDSWLEAGVGVGRALAQVGVLLGVAFVCGPISWGHPSRRYVATAALLAFALTDVAWSTRFAVRVERAYSKRAGDLVAKARAALGHAGDS